MRNRKHILHIGDIIFMFPNALLSINKVGCVFAMVVLSLLPHVDFGQNDHRNCTPLYILNTMHLET